MNARAVCGPKRGYALRAIAARAQAKGHQISHEGVAGVLRAAGVIAEYGDQKALLGEADNGFAIALRRAALAALSR
jgi:hypothetical protein